MNQACESIIKRIQSGYFYRIAFVGDSITSTEWVHPNWREIVEYVLKEEIADYLGEWKTPSWKIRCFNCGFDGATTVDLIDLIEEGVLAVKPTMVLLMIGDNDVHLGISTPEVYAENVRTIVNEFQGQGVKNVVVLTPPPSLDPDVNAKFEPYFAKVQALAHDGIVEMCDVWDEFLAFDLKRFYTFEILYEGEAGFHPGDIDYLHPNQLGNAYIAKVVLDKIFGIEFDPEKYIQTSSDGLKYPEY